MSTGQPPCGATEKATLTTVDAQPGRGDRQGAGLGARARRRPGRRARSRSVGVDRPLTSPVSQEASEVTVTGTLRDVGGGQGDGALRDRAAHLAGEATATTGCACSTVAVASTVNVDVTFAVPPAVSVTTAVIVCVPFATCPGPRAVPPPPYRRRSRTARRSRRGSACRWRRGCRGRTRRCSRRSPGRGRRRTVSRSCAPSSGTAPARSALPLTCSEYVVAGGTGRSV